MYSQIISAALLATSVQGGVIKYHKRQVSNPTPSWTTGDPGNVTILFSDETINWGTSTPHDVLQQLYSACQYGTCDTNPFTADTNIPDSGSAPPIGQVTLTVSVGTADYPTWARNGLVDSMIAALDSVTTEQDYTYSPNGICTSGPDCVWEPDVTVSMYTAPSSMQIVYESTDTSQAPIGVLSVGVVEGPLPGDGFCSTFTTVGSAVAGAVNGVAGGIFSLIGLACQS